MDVSIRKAGAQDSEILHSLIYELAAYQGHGHRVTVTSQDMHKMLSSTHPPFACLIAEKESKVIGYALFCQTYFSWEGRPAIYLDDLYVIPEERSNGIGKLLMAEIAKIAIEQGCKRIELFCHTDNQKAADFYSNLGAKAVPEYVRWQFTEANFDQLSDLNKLNFSNTNQLSVCNPA